MWLAIGITAAFLLIVFGVPRLLAFYVNHSGAKCIEVDNPERFVVRDFVVIEAVPHRIIKVDHKNKLVVCVVVKDNKMAARVMELAKNQPKES